MQNLNKIIEKIEAEAQAQTDAVWAETQQKIEEMQAETEREILHLEEESEAQAKREKDAILTRAAAAIAMKEREILLREKTDLIDQVYQIAEQAICDLPQEAYTMLLAKLAANAVAERVETVRFLQKEYSETEFEGEEETGYVLQLSSSDRTAVGMDVLALAQEILAEKTENPPVLTLAEETADIHGGVIVCYGDTQTTCSIPVLLKGLRTELDPKVIQILFGDEEKDTERHRQPSA